MILYLLIALTILYVGYVSTVTARYGVLHSISRSFYTLQEKKKGGWFRALMFTSGLILILVAAFAGSPFSWLLYMSGMGALLTGVAALYLDRITGIVHYIASGAMLIFALLFIGFIFSWIPAIVIATGVITVFGNREKMPNPVFWGEIYAFTGVLISLLWWSITL